MQELLTNTLLLFIQFKAIAIIKSVFVVFISLILLITTAQPYFVQVLADNDDDNDKPSTFQLGDLRMCYIQEKNIQGHTIIGTIFADICQGTESQ